MAILDGLHGELTINGGGAGEITVANVRRWRGKFARRMVNVTPKNSSYAVYMPSHIESRVFIEAYIDNVTTPGFFDTSSGYILKLTPDAAKTNKNITLNVRVEDVEWNVGIDEPNSFTAICRGITAPVLDWSPP